ncbi:unnamed protein product [Medioppia subpectinata]|uniref:UDP-glycosyltransferase n=1 Tax=Medioppia subpectinata TaxID=1979941 RepID=A0A7R9Q310_9ACAR|nr:unnamed protein product [Medioppia subpectinata]CAG2109983.1 unnamed protein product [Medioppia subpectinata]
MANKSLKVLFVPLLNAGHVNPCIAIAEQLIDSGHRAVFAVDSVWSGKLTAYGIDEIVLAKTDRPLHSPNDTPDATREMMASVMFSDASALQKAIIRAKHSDLWTKYAIKMDKQLERLLPDIRPDVIIVDQLIALPAVELSGIPCVWVWSGGILEMVNDERAPPRQSGLSATGDQKLWQEFRQIVKNNEKDEWRAFNHYVVGRGCEPLPEYYFHNPSHYLNIYGYPLELDYQDIRPLGRNFVEFDHFMRTERHLTFAVPPELAAKPGKLVYFSLGSIASMDVSNMRRLVAILAKSPHRFIVSKGPLHMDYTLADNMWGEASVPQIQVLPLVDLVLTHGGINTVTESLYFGRPMIAMPVFGEQYDNAQRLQDKGFGLRLDAYRCSEKELLAAIETLLSDRRLTERLAEDAFTASHNVAKQFIISDNDMLKQNTIYELMSKFTNLIIVQLDDNDKFTMVPDNAFGNQPKLKQLTIRSAEKSIGSHAFSGLTGLRTLNVNYDQLSHISANAFAIDKHSNESLTISLNRNLLNENRLSFLLD